MSDSTDIAVQFEKHLGSPKQTWLLGAGISSPSNIPLMVPLTERILDLATTVEFICDDVATHIVDFIRADISENANIEDFLTHLGDFISMSERSRTCSVYMDGQIITRDKLVFVHEILLRLISETVRWGYKPAIRTPDGDEIEPEMAGEKGQGIVTIDEHMEFVQSIFGSVRAGLEVVRPPVEFFTTNYDTLLEDALSLNEINYQDGFSGGGVGFWSISNYEYQPSTQAIVTKLHGSIDWHSQSETRSRLFRVRNTDTYPAEGGVAMIYPQATKYLYAQRDPFSELFQRFRKRLAKGVDQVLLICGYSFGDKHVNAEVEIALSAPKSQLTVIAFAEEPGGNMPAALNSWRNHDQWGDQVFVAGSQGLYQGRHGPFFTQTNGSRQWWKFSGVTKLLANGLPDDILEKTQ